jgi:hypothetical protein
LYGAQRNRTAPYKQITSTAASLLEDRNTASYQGVVFISEIRQWTESKKQNILCLITLRHALFSLLLTSSYDSLDFALHGPVWHFTCTNGWKKLCLAFV